MIGCSDQRTGVGENLAESSQVTEGVHFPGEVIETDRTPPRRRVRGASADREETQIVIVAGSLRLEEDRTGKLQRQSAKPEFLGIEVCRTVGISDVYNRLVRPV